MGMEKLSLWAVPVYYFFWEHHETHKNNLVDICYSLEKRNDRSGVAPNVKQGLYESGFNFLNEPHESVAALAEFVKHSTFRAASDANRGLWTPGMNVQIKLHESWCHITRNGGYHDVHTHPGSSWSSIYYLDCAEMSVEPKNGLNRFYRPYDCMFKDASTMYLETDNSIDLNAKDGMLIVFPSWIQHSAMPYSGTQDRLVIAVNSQITIPDMSSVAIPV